MHETPDERRALQQLLDECAADAGPHLRSIITDERRLDADDLCRRLQGMCLLAPATVTADGRPLVGPVDGYLLHGGSVFSSGSESVCVRHLAARPGVSATYLPGEALAVTVHGRAGRLEGSDPMFGALRRAMLDHYVPTQDPAFEEWLDAEDLWRADRPGQDVHLPSLTQWCDLSGSPGCARRSTPERGRRCARRRC